VDRERIVVAALTILLAVALCIRIASRGGPYFERPSTITEHVGAMHGDFDDVLVLCRRAASRMPRGASVACFRPNGGDDYLIAVGQLPKQQVWPAYGAARDRKCDDVPAYVLAVREPFTHPCFVQIDEWPEGRLYRSR
jgi:hypothetical protein